MNYLHIFRVSALCLAGAASHAQDLAPAALAGPPPARMACPAGDGASEGKAGTSPYSYTLLHDGSGIETFGFSLSRLVANVGGPALPGGVRSAAEDPEGSLAGCCDPGRAIPGGACLARIGAPGDAPGLPELLEDVAARDATVSILRTFDGDALRLETRHGPRLFAIPELYVTRDMLRHRDLVGDTELGRIVAVAR